MRVASDRLSVRWYLGHDHFEPLPDHSNLTRTRERFGLPVFRRFFERIVEECVEAGLVLGDNLFFDSTKVEGNAAVDSLAPRWAVEAHLGGLFEEEQEEGEHGLGAGWPTRLLPSAGDADLRGRNATRKDWISRDGGKARIVLNVLVAPAEVSENRPMLDLLWRTCFRLRLRPHHVTGDGKYGTLENISALERAGVSAYVALHESGDKPSFFPKSEFRYDAEEDVYVCPAGKLLRALGKKGPGEEWESRVTTYRSKASGCASCELRPRCTTNKNGRQVRRSPGERYVDRVRGYRQTKPYRRAIRKRKVWMESLFAEGKAWHGTGRFRLRTLRRVNAEVLLVASDQNLKRLPRW